jgi:hypothetical protein
MDFCLESQQFGKSLETFGSKIFFLRFKKTIGWYGFSYVFLAVLDIFHQCFILFWTNNHSFKCYFIKDCLWCTMHHSLRVMYTVNYGLPPPSHCTVVLLCCDIMLMLV